MTGESEFADRLAALQSRFLARSKRDHAYLQDALAALAEGDESGAGETRRIVHVLAGTAGTFGYPRLSAAADELEAALVASPEDRDHVLATGRRLLAELEALKQAD